MSICISYDTDALELIYVTDTGLLKGATLNTTYDSPYQITWVDGSTTENNTQTGTIATLTFKILEGTPTGEYAVVLELLGAYDVKYAVKQFSATSGTVNVNCVDRSYGSGSSKPQLPTPLPAASTAYVPLAASVKTRSFLRNCASRLLA